MPVKIAARPFVLAFPVILVALVLSASAASACPRNPIDPRGLTAETRALLAGLERAVGTVHLVAACVNKRMSTDARRMSEHAHGRAFDFTTLNKPAAVKWLRNNGAHLVMTYRDMNHIHADLGSYHAVILGASSGRR